MKTRTLLKRILQYSWQASPFTLVLLMVVSVLFCVIKFMEIKVFEGLIGTITLIYKGQTLSTLTVPLLSLGSLLVLTPLVELVEYIVRGYFWRRGHGYMQTLLHKRIGDKDLIDFENQGALDQLKKASLGSSETPNNIRVMVQIGFLYLPFLGVVAYYLFTIKPLLLAVLLLIFIPLLVSEIVKMKDHFDFEGKVANVRRRMDYYERAMIDKVHFKETLQNNGFDYFNGKLMVAIHEFTRARKNLNFKGFKIQSQMNALNTLGYGGVIGLLVVYLMRGQIAISEFAAIYYAIDKITSMLTRLISDLGEVMSEMATTTYLVDYLEGGPLEQKEASLPKTTTLHLENISFYYPSGNKAALDGVSISIPVGTSLAIVGENGSGKSTLAKVIMGLYKPSAGRVCYGSENLNGYSSKSKYQGVSGVFQDFTKYKLTLEENVRLSFTDQEAHNPVSVAIKESHFNMEKLSKGALSPPPSHCSG